MARKLLISLLNKTSNGYHQVIHYILLAHFEYQHSKNKSGYPVDPDVCLTTRDDWMTTSTVCVQEGLLAVGEGTQHICIKRFMKALVSVLVTSLLK